MSNLSERDTIQKVEAAVVGDKKILEAFSSEMIKNCPIAMIENVLLPIIGKAFADAGRNPEDEKLTWIVVNFPIDLKKLLPNMRINEIKIAVERGLLREFGDYYGINLSELLRFCKAHFESVERSNTIKSITFTPVKDQESKEPPRSERWETFKINLFRSFNKFKNTGNYDAVAPSLYDILDEIGLINLSTPEKFELMELAAQRVISDQNLKLSVLVADHERKPLKNIIEQIQTSINEQKPVSGDAKAFILAKCKKLALDDFFREITDLPGIIESKKEFYLSL